MQKSDTHVVLVGSSRGGESACMVFTSDKWTCSNRYAEETVMCFYEGLPKTS